MQFRVAFGVVTALLVAACSNADNADNASDPSLASLASWKQQSDGTLAARFVGDVEIVVRCWRQGDMQDCIGGPIGTKLFVRRQLNALPNDGGTFDAMKTTGFICRVDGIEGGYTQMLRTQAGVIKLATVPDSSPMSRAEMLGLMSTNDLLGPGNSALFNCRHLAEAIDNESQDVLISVSLDYNEIDTMDDAEPMPVPSTVAAPQPTQVRQVTSTAPFQWSSTENALIGDWYRANEECRGGMEPDATQRACDRREVAGNKLFEMGICYGEVDQIGADMHMHRCHSRSSQMNY